MRDTTTVEKVEITEAHLKTIREKWDCEGMSDDDIMAAMLRYEKRVTKGADVLEVICFPNFQSYLNHIKQ